MKQVRARCTECDTAFTAVLPDDRELRPNVAGEHQTYCHDCKRRLLRSMHKEVKERGSLIISVREPDGSTSLQGIIFLRGSLRIIPLIGSATPTMFTSEALT